MEDVWLLQNVFRFLQSDLAVAGRGGKEEGGGKEEEQETRNPPRIQNTRSPV